jgi:hypothetical protein
MPNKPLASYLAVYLQLKTIDLFGLATFSINYTSEITDTYENSIVDIFSPLFILSSLSTTGIILYPQYDNDGTYMINSA